MKKLAQSYWEFLFSALAVTVLVLVSMDHIFFWDTVQLGAKHALFYYENNLQLQFLPNEIDSGHIPTFGYLLALIWTVFGKSLWISHLLVLPFAIGITWQLYSLAVYFFQRKNVKWVMLIVLLDTTILSQISLVSPDVPLLFFFLFAVNSILWQNKWFIALAFSCLFLISLRGMILTVPLFIFEVVWFWNLTQIKNKGIYIIKTGIPYIPAALVFLSFSYYHYAEKGWIGYHENSPWAVFFEKESAKGMLKNALIYGWRIVDFGRVFLWIITGIVFFLVGFKSVKGNQKFRQLVLLFALIIGFLSIPAILYVDLKGHRYFMPVYIAFSLVSLYLLLEINKNLRWKKVGISVAVIGLFSGSFWVYPREISQGWDSTLGHFPYYQLRSNMIRFMDENGIDKQQVGFDFPGAYPQKYLDLSEDEWTFPEVDMNSQKIVLYSNVVNEFTPEEIIELENNWEVLYAQNSRTVEFTLYKK